VGTRAIWKKAIALAKVQHFQDGWYSNLVPSAKAMNQKESPIYDLGKCVKLIDTSTYEQLLGHAMCSILNTFYAFRWIA
jgi:hypothetical protein